jgi:magnesium transporter
MSRRISPAPAPPPPSSVTLASRDAVEAASAAPVAAVSPPPPRSIYREPDGTVRRDLSVQEIARVVAGGTGVLWVDLDSAARSHTAILEHACRFHPLTIEDTLNPDSRVKLEEFRGYLFMIIRGVGFHEETEDPYDLATRNLCFYLGPNYLVTVHAGPSAEVTAVADWMDRNPELLERGADRLMHALMDAAVDAYFPILDQIDGFIDGLEERVFADFDRSCLHDIFAVKRLVLSLRRHLAPQREVFNILTNRPSPLLAPESQIYFRDIYDHVLRINDSLETYRDLLSSTLDAYLTQVSNRLGSVTKGLSMVATMSVPFVVVSGMWGMNVPVPFAQSPRGFVLLVLIQLGLGAGLLLLLRRFRFF